MENVTTEPLETEFAFFLAYKKALLRKYKGRYVVIKGTEVIGDYAGELKAVRQTAQIHDLGTFLVQKVEPGTAAYTQTFHTGIAFV